MNPAVENLLFKDTGLRSPKQLPDLAAWFDALDPASMVVDSSNRVQLWADKSGNSAVNCLCLNAVAGNYASAPDSAAVSVTGDIDIRVQVAMNDWTPAAESFLVAKYGGGGAGNTSYCFTVLATGVLRFFWSPDGSSASTITKDSTTATGLTDLSTRWVRVTLDVDNGSTQNEVKFYTSADGATWVQLGTTVTTAGVTAIGDTTRILEIGACVTGTAGMTAGRFYRAQIRNNILDNGTGLQFDANFTAVAKLATSFTESSANAATVTINTSGDTGARISGERDLVQMTASKQPVLLRWLGQNYLYTPASVSSWSTSSNTTSNPATDIDISGYISLATLTPSALSHMAAKWGAAGQRSWQASLNTNGSLRFTHSQDGTASIVASSSALLSANGVVVGTGFWWRITRASASGSVNFYTGADGVNWSSLGVAQSTTAGAIFASNAAISVADIAAASSWVAGNTYRCRVHDGIAGTLVADFDPSRYTSGTTFVASTGETWTLNGGAVIVTRTGIYGDGSNDYFKTPPFNQAQPESLYLVLRHFAWTAGRVIVDGGSNYSMDLEQSGAGGAATPELLIYAGGATSTALGTFAVHEDGVACAVFNGTASSLAKNREAAVSPSLGTTAANGLTVFGRGDGASGVNGMVYELCLYSAIHTRQLRSRIAIYAGRRHRIAV